MKVSELIHELAQLKPEWLSKPVKVITDKGELFVSEVSVAGTPISEDTDMKTYNAMDGAIVVLNLSHED